MNGSVIYRQQHGSCGRGASFLSMGCLPRAAHVSASGDASHLASCVAQHDPDRMRRLNAEAQEREQKRRFRAAASGQNVAAHLSHSTTVPSRRRPRLARLVARMVSRPCGEIVRGASAAARGERAARKLPLAPIRSRALSAMIFRVAIVTKPRVRASP